MRKLIAVLLTAVFVCTCFPAFAAKAPVVTKQPAEQKTGIGGECTFEIEVSGYQSLTWYFYNPETEEKVLATKAPKMFKGLKISGKNGRHFKLSNIPESLNGWQVYCHCYNSGKTADSEYALLLVGDEPPVWMREQKTAEPAGTAEEPAVPEMLEGPEENPGDAGPGEEEYPEDEEEPDEYEEDAEDEETEDAEEPEDDTPETVDVTKVIESVPEGMCRVVCTRCRFTGGGNTWVRSGIVPAGTEITVTGGSAGRLYKGYSINGGEYGHKTMATFRMTVTEDTQIEMHR